MANVLINKATMSAIGNSIRTKGGTTAKLLPADMPKAITDIKGTELNIAYGNSPPADTSKLWCKCVEPNKVVATNKIEYGKEIVSDSGMNMLKKNEGSCCASINNNIYIFGGGTENSVYINDIYKLDYKNKRISAVGTLPLPIGYACCGVIGQYIYVFGGYTEGKYLNTIYKFNTNTNQIEDKDGNATTQPISTFPNALGYSCCASVKDKIYIFGGYTGNALTNKIYEFNGKNITEIAVMPFEKYMAGSCVSIEDNIYVVGGFKGSTPQNGYLNTIYKFNTKTKKTKLLTTLPQQLRDICCSVVGNNIYTFGGLTIDNTCTNRIYKINVLTEDVTQCGTLPQAIRLSCSTSIGTLAFAFGGRNNQNEPISNIYQLSTPVVLTQNNLLLDTGFGDTRFNIINTTDIQIGSPLDSVYLGNAQNEAEPVEAYLHNGTDWELI